MVPQQKDRISALNIFGIFIIISVLISFVGYYAFILEKTKLLENKKNELLMLTQIKADQIVEWLDRKRSYAMSLQEGVPNIESVRDSLLPGTNTALLDKVQSRIKSYVKISNVGGAQLFDIHGKLFYSTGRVNTDQSDKLKSQIAEAVRTGKTIETDIYADSTGQKLYFDFVIPLQLKINGKPTTVALEVFSMDPDKELFPLILAWPNKSPSSESFIVRKENDRVVFLSELRFRNNAPLKLRLPLTQDATPAVRAVKGFDEGTLEGVDYRGIQVITATKKISGTKWHLITKTDYLELMRPLLKQRILIVSLNIIAVLFFGVLLAYMWSSQKNRWLSEVYEYEQKQKVLNKKYEILAKYANDIIFLADESYKLVEANQKAEDVYGYTKEEFMKMTVQELRAGEDKNRVEGQFADIKPAGGSVYEVWHQKKDGTIFPIESSTRKLDIDGKFYYQGIIRDISDRKKAENKIVLMNRLLRVISDINQLALKETNIKNFFENTCRLLINNSVFKMAWIGVINEADGVVDSYASFGVGAEEVRQFSYKEGPAAHRLLKKVIESGKHTLIEDIIVSNISERGVQNAKKYAYQSAGCFPIFREGKLYGILMVYTGTGNTIFKEEGELLVELAMDISFAVEFHNQLSKQEELKIQLVQSEKMSAIGQLAAGVAHEINNPMTSILGFTQLLLRLHKEGDADYEKLKIIQTSSQRCKDIVQQLLIYSRAKQTEPMPFDIHALIDGVLGLVENQFRVSNVTIEKKYAKELPLVHVSQQVEQVFMNLVTNARDAIAPNAGTITITTALVNGMVEVKFKDTGAGIDKKNLENIFSPFFTTKKAGQGTGLGLSIVKKMVSEMHGSISVESEIGKGTTFTLLFPPKSSKS